MILYCAKYRCSHKILLVSEVSRKKKRKEKRKNKRKKSKEKRIERKKNPILPFSHVKSIR